AALPVRGEHHDRGLRERVLRLDAQPLHDAEAVQLRHVEVEQDELAPPQPATLCALTLFCVEGDIHASDASGALYPLRTRSWFREPGTASGPAGPHGCGP